MTKLAIPMDDKQATAWRERVESGSKLVKRFSEQWKTRQASYAGVPLKAEPTDDVVLVNKDMPRVKQKVSQLFYQVPEIHLKPKAPQYMGAVSVFGAVLNHKLTEEIKVEKTS